MARFCALFSSSSGNCTYIESGNSAVLVDAGVSTRSICNALIKIGSSIEKIKAVLVTHEHSDHIKGLKTMLSKYKIPVYANGGTISGILDTFDADPSLFVELKTGDSTTICDMGITSYKTSHDSRESCGYIINTDDNKKIAVATDLGFVSDTVFDSIDGSDLIMLESNHDVGMLENGRYPYFLKRRILSKTGHLSNEACAEVLPRLYNGGTHRFVLAHLSKDNNYPDLALQTAISAMKISDIPQSDYEIEVAPRSGPERVFEI